MQKEEIALLSVRLSFHVTCYCLVMELTRAAASTDDIMVERVAGLFDVDAEELRKLQNMKKCKRCKYSIKGGGR